jgi:hypothetical protein
MENEREEFDSAGFLDLLAQVMTSHATGVVSVQIHVRDGMPWAVSVRFDDSSERAA